ncbi:MAG TPA: hypothetical protein VML75_16200 [Kofleriaceae bacterium]|nr:hypothetical protein [Kofleriaceae bacterium]
MNAHELGEERSIAMHRAVADRLRLHPELLDAARTRVQRWLADGTVHPRYAAAWKELLELPLDQLTAFLTDRSEQARTLRSTSPFAGVLDPRERWRIHREVGRTSGR